MDNATLYIKANPMQSKDARESMDEFSHVFKWAKDETILDIGCGPGDVTSTILKRYVPEDATLIGGDISTNMVEFANLRFRSDRVSFRLLDIEQVPWDSWLRESFDKIFSFYCFHWIQNETWAMENMNNLLKENGQLFLVFLAHVPIFDLYRNLSRDPDWAMYMQDAEKFICKYHDSDNPADEFRQLLIDQKFRNVKVTTRTKYFSYETSDQLLSSVFAVNPFVPRIPSNLLPSYKEAIRKCITNMKLAEQKPSGQLEVSYSLIVAYAAK